MKKEIFLTFDLEWSIDPITAYVLKILDSYSIRGTFLITHFTPLLYDMLASGHELGIHPNFNKLLNNSEADGNDYYSIVDDLINIVPGAKTVRSHSCVTGSNIRAYFSKVGLQYELNTIIKPQSGMVVRPWKIGDLWQVPYIFEDDVYFDGTKTEDKDYWFMTTYDIPRVMNFHPIHIFLNCESMDRYEGAKEYLNEIDILSSFQNRNCEKKGAEDLLRSIIETGLNNDYRFSLIKDMAF